MKIRAYSLFALISMALSVPAAAQTNEPSTQPTALVVDKTNSRNSLL